MRPPPVQIEVTTQCNLTCFYCIGRHMPQQHMQMDVFASVLGTLPAGSSVHLQGEGEPLMHPHFQTMIDHCRARGFGVTTTTNGTIPFDLDKVDRLDVSLDTLSVAQNAKSGRNHFEKTLKNLITWISQAPHKLIIRITHYGQDIASVVEFCKTNHLKYTIQALNPKEDYGRCYNIAPVPKPQIGRASCPVAASGNLAFSVEGEKRPCCFIKYQTQTYDQILNQFSQGLAPKDCKGCPILKVTA